MFNALSKVSIRLIKVLRCIFKNHAGRENIYEERQTQLLILYGLRLTIFFHIWSRMIWQTTS